MSDLPDVKTMTNSDLRKEVLSLCLELDEEKQQSIIGALKAFPGLEPQDQVSLFANAIGLEGGASYESH